VDRHRSAESSHPLANAYQTGAAAGIASFRDGDTAPVIFYGKS
jgi:hypothetical protein